MEERSLESCFHLIRPRALETINKCCSVDMTVILMLGVRVVCVCGCVRCVRVCGMCMRNGVLYIVRFAYVLLPCLQLEGL